MSDNEVITIRLIATRKVLHTIDRVLVERIRDLDPFSRPGEDELRDLKTARYAIQWGLKTEHLENLEKLEKERIEAKREHKDERESLPGGGE